MKYVPNIYIADIFINTLIERYINMIKTTTLIICIIGIITGTPFIMNGGFYLFTLVDECASLITGFVVILLEIYIIIKELGPELMKEINNNATKKTIPEYVFYSLEKINPIYLSILMILSIIETVRFIKYSLPLIEIIKYFGRLYSNG
jgi:SNF family Na+-dependent transporter